MSAIACHILHVATSYCASMIFITVAHVMNDADREDVIEAYPGNRGFIVSHKEFDYGQTGLGINNIKTNPLSLKIGQHSRIDIKFRYINLKSRTSGSGCESFLKFDNVKGYTDNYYFELCAQDSTQAAWDYYLYPFFGDSIKLNFISSASPGRYGFLLEYRGWWSF